MVKRGLFRQHAIRRKKTPRLLFFLLPYPAGDSAPHPGCIGGTAGQGCPTGDARDPRTSTNLIKNIDRTINCNGNDDETAAPAAAAAAGLRVRPGSEPVLSRGKGLPRNSP